MLGPVYNPANDETYFVLYGDNWRYRDLIADGGTFDPAMMDVGYDDSTWSVGPQPFRNGYATSFFTFDEFGTTGGTPDVPGTLVTISPTSVDVVARIQVNIPADSLINPISGRARQWDVTITAVQLMQLWFDGEEVDVIGPESGFTEWATSLLGEMTAGVHTMAFRLSSFVSAQPPDHTVPGAMGGATLTTSHRYTPPLAKLPDEAYVAEVRAEARLRPGIRMDGG